MAELTTATAIVDGDIDDGILLPVREGATVGLLKMTLGQLKAWLRLTESFIVALGDETTAITVGNKVPPWKRTFLPLPFCARRATFFADEPVATKKKGYLLLPCESVHQPRELHKSR